MTVDDLRATLNQVLGLLRATDAKATTIRELGEFVEQTKGFSDLTLKSFVKLAEAGKAPPVPRAVGNGDGRGGRSGGTPNAGALSGAVKNLYDRAADPGVTEEQMRGACAALSGLTKTQMVEVAASLGLQGVKSNTKDSIVTAITERLLDRKRSAIRNQLVHRPTESAAETKGSAAAVPTTSWTEG